MKKIVFIVGPTAVGKTEVALKLGQLVPCEFISADSMQIYKGMDVLTAKLPHAIRRKYHHYLIDVVRPNQTFSVADYCLAVNRALGDIFGHKNLPVVIGGTGLYVNALLYGIFEGPSADKKLRQRLEKIAQTKGNVYLYEELRKIDPDAAIKIKPNDLRRIIRALEVYEMTKKPISQWQKHRHGLADGYQVYVFGLRRDRSDLYLRIDQRVDFMVNEGVLDEVRNLLRQKLSSTAFCAIGIKEIEAFFKGKHALEEAIRLMKQNSRHFAKRQMTWFNKNKDIIWLDLKEDEDSLFIARKILHQVSKVSL